jgi:hypothetical protein
MRPGVPGFQGELEAQQRLWAHWFYGPDDTWAALFERHGVLQEAEDTFYCQPCGKRPYGWAQLNNHLSSHGHANKVRWNRAGRPACRTHEEFVAEGATLTRGPAPAWVPVRPAAQAPPAAPPAAPLPPAGGSSSSQPQAPPPGSNAWFDLAAANARITALEAEVMLLKDRLTLLETRLRR